MQDATTAERIRQKYRSLSPLMDERMRRQWAASEADSLGWGGASLVSNATGLARNTIAVGAEKGVTLIYLLPPAPNVGVDQKNQAGRLGRAWVDPSAQGTSFAAEPPPPRRRPRAIQ